MKDKKQHTSENIGGGYGETTDYKKLIADIVDKIKNPKLIERIYYFAEYLYIHKDGS